MTDDVEDRIWRSLRRLPCLEPDAGRVERVRARYRAAVARRIEQAERSARRKRYATLVIEPALVGALGLIYLSAVVHDVLRLHGVR